LFPDLNTTPRTISQEYYLNRDLIGQPQDVSRIATGWLNTNVVTAFESFGNIVNGWGKRAKFRVKTWITV